MFSDTLIITSTIDGGVVIETDDGTVRLTPAQTFELLSWLASHSSTLYLAIQHGIEQEEQKEQGHA